MLNGHAPLVDFHAQYGQLLAYVGAGAPAAVRRVARRLRGRDARGHGRRAGGDLRRPSAGSPAARCSRSRCSCRSSPPSFFMEVGPLANRFGPANLFSLFPIRYAGPYVLAVAGRRAMSRRRRRQRARCCCSPPGSWRVNNPEFGAAGVRGVARRARRARAAAVRAAALGRLGSTAAAGASPARSCSRRC